MTEAATASEVLNLAVKKTPLLKLGKHIVLPITDLANRLGLTEEDAVTIEIVDGGFRAVISRPARAGSFAEA